MRQSLHTLARLRRAASWAAVAAPLEWKFPPDAARKLQESIRGLVVIPSDERYHTARQGFVPNYQAFPQLIVYCDVFSDVAAALAFARCWKLSPVCRAGGHSTAGYSVNDELVIDVSRLSYVTVDVPRETAVVGAGTTFGRVNATLDSFGLHLVGGGCDDVAVAGFMLGGGYGYTSLIYGMNCDNVIAARVMLADGSIVLASEHEHSDLFWALRGGTGNNFGVLLEVTYRLHRLNEVWGFGIRWTAKDAPVALEALQEGYTGRAVPKHMGHQSTLNYDGDEICLLLRGMYAGDAGKGRTLLAPLLKTKGASLDIDLAGGYTELNDHLNSTPQVPSVPPRTRTQADSRYVARRLSADEWGKVVGHVEKSPNRSNFVGLEAYGGRISSIGPGDSAFVHRDAHFNVYTWVFWQDGDEETASLAYLEEFRNTLTPYSNGRAYQNYPNTQNLHYREMYWGDNFPRLLEIKRRYDPGALFSFGQSISPPP